MRFYPFGSSSLNPVYNAASAVTASIASYTVSASYGLRVVSASIASSGSAGATGAAGICIYQSGSTGLTGSAGPTGYAGTVSNPFAFPAT